MARESSVLKYIGSSHWSAHGRVFGVDCICRVKYKCTILYTRHTNATPKLFTSIKKTSKIYNRKFKTPNGFFFLSLLNWPTLSYREIRTGLSFHNRPSSFFALTWGIDRVSSLCTFFWLKKRESWEGYRQRGITVQKVPQPGIRPSSVGGGGVLIRKWNFYLKRAAMMRAGEHL